MMGIHIVARTIIHACTSMVALCCKVVQRNEDGGHQTDIQKYLEKRYA